MNERIKERCNITAWHEAGYTGKGVKIAVIDTSNELYNYQKSYIKQPFPNMGSSVGGHLGSCCAVIHEVAPDAEIIALPVNEAGYRYAIEWGADIVSASIVSWRYDFVDKEYPNHNIITFGAAGNDAGHINEPYPASYDWSFAVAGVEATTDKYYRTSSANAKMDCCGYTYVNVLTDKGTAHQFTGTSCATPWVAGMYALVRQRYGKKSWQWAKEFIHTNCYDYCVEGWDVNSGYGLFILPEVNNMKIEMTIGSNKAFVDGKEVELLRAPEVKNGTTLVPIRFVAETLGCDVDYESATKKITITR